MILIIQGGWCVEAKNYNGVVQVIIWDDDFGELGGACKDLGGTKNVLPDFAFFFSRSALFYSGFAGQKERL